MQWTTRFDTVFLKDLKKLDKGTAKRILRYISDIESLDDPRARGKALTGNLVGFWRYRVGDYRVIVEIQDNQLVILALKAAHRSEAYRWKP